MNLSDRIARSLATEKRLANVPIPVIEECVRQTLEALALMPFPDDTTLADALDGEWESCEGCAHILGADEMQHDGEGVPLCPECMAGLVAESAPQS